MFLCAYAAHQLGAAPPVWPVVVGPSSTGKTEICINAFMGLPGTHVIGMLSPKAFLAGRGGKQGSLLRRIGDSGILLFKDMGTTISQRDYERMEVTSALREIYDGVFSRQVGGVFIPVWEGKITILAAAVPAIDRAWSVMDELGERFVFVRWRRGDSQGQGRRAMAQVGNERDIRQRTQHLVADFLTGAVTSPPPLPSDPIQDALIDLAELAACLRTRVRRDSHGNRDIIDVPEPEGIGRLLKSLTLLTTFHAALWGRETASWEDLAIARRVALDSIPSARSRFLSAFDAQGEASWVDTVRQGVAKGSVNWVAQELEALGVIEKHEQAEVYYTLRPKFTSIFAKIKGCNFVSDDSRKLLVFNNSLL